jgi:hypothetical protein
MTRTMTCPQCGHAFPCDSGAHAQMCPAHQDMHDITERLQRIAQQVIDVQQLLSVRTRERDKT